MAFLQRIKKTYETHKFTASAIKEATALIKKGRFIEAIHLASEKNRYIRNPILEKKIVEWRYSAFNTLDMPQNRPDWPPVLHDPFPGLTTIPEITFSKLNSDRMGGAILHHGCIIVRGLATAEEASLLAKGINQAIDARKAFENRFSIKKTLPWYAPIPLSPESAVKKGRTFLTSDLGVLAADSPRMLFDFIDFFRRKKIDRIIGDYLGEYPMLSVGKTTLRRVPHDTSSYSEWHQDGAFLGSEVRTVNMWLALSHCGVDAPGIDIVPNRIPYVVQTGKLGTFLDWTVGFPLAESLAGEKGIAKPIFAPGDAVFFDHLLLHRTGAREGLKHDRLAIESWFFAPSTFPLNQEPIVI